MSGEWRGRPAWVSKRQSPSQESPSQGEVTLTHSQVDPWSGDRGCSEGIWELGPSTSTRSFRQVDLFHPLSRACKRSFQSLLPPGTPAV